MRYISNILAAILLVVITLASLAVAFTVVTNYIKTRQPRGEIIDYYIVVEKHTTTTLASVKVSLFISCNGPNCDQYTVSDITLTGYTRGTDNTVPLSVSTTTYRLKQGLTRIDILGYYNKNTNINELVVEFILLGPGVYRTVYKSVSIG